MTLEYRGRLLISVAAMLGGAAFQLVIPRLLGASVDQALTLSGTTSAAERGDEISVLLVFAGLIIGASLLRGGLAYVHTYLGESMGQHMAYRLRLAYYEKLQRLSFSYHDKIHTGDIITRGIVDIEGLRRFVNFALLRTILLLFLLGGGAYLVISIDWQLGLVAISFAPLVGFIAIRARLKLREEWLTAQKNLSALSTVMDENLSGTRVVRAFAAQDYEMNKYDKASNKVATSLRKLIATRSFSVSVMNFLFLSAAGAVLAFGASKVAAGAITVGDLTALIAFMFVMQQPVQQLGLMVNAYARTYSTGKRLFEVLDSEIEVRDAPNARHLILTEGVLKFENVSFEYSDAFGGGSTISNVSFTVSPNRTVGIVGPPGSGKSTIAHLIPRFYDVTGGRVTIDGQDIRDVSLRSLRNAVSIVEQDNYLFTTSAENNVAYADPWASMDNIIEVTKVAQLHDYIEGTNLGYATPIGERGVSLSGGQRQRMSIARSLLQNPAIIVFDDSTSAIDAGTEQRIRAALNEMTDDRGVIIISHRLSSLMHADEILVIEDGVISERGSHDDLLAQNGAYKKLYDLQIRPNERKQMAKMQ